MSVRQLLIILLSTILYPLAVSAYTGIPPVINYTRDSYNGDAHNWNASIDNNGIVYVANTDGLLSFDGSKWHLRQTQLHFIIVSNKNLRLKKRGSMEHRGTGRENILPDILLLHCL